MPTTEETQEEIRQDILKLYQQRDPSVPISAIAKKYGKTRKDIYAVIDEAGIRAVRNARVTPEQILKVRELYEMRRKNPQVIAAEMGLEPWKVRYIIREKLK